MNNKLKDFFDKTTEHYLEYKPNDRHLKLINSLDLKKKKVLSLGCGSGREVRELVKRGFNVTAIDFSVQMIKESKQIEPKAIYFCEDVVDFAERNKKTLKFDYILGLFSLLNYIPRQKRAEFVKNLYAMLSPRGKIVFELRRVTDRWQDIVKVFINYIRYPTREFGDVWCEGYFGHHFTKRQIKHIFMGYNYRLNKNWITVLK